MGTLYVVATPIGNLEDITLRALRILKSVSLVAAEDTRSARRLLRHYGIDTRITSFFEHSSPAKLASIVRLLQTEDIALISEAGMPAISDPGYELVAAAIAQGAPVLPAPGPSAVLAALAVSGLPTDRFLYLGFLPRRSNERRRVLAGAAGEPGSLVFYEAPHRLLHTLDDMLVVLGDRRIAVARELTKVFEEVRRSTVSQALAHFQATAPRGEFTLVVEGNTRPAAAPPADDALQARLAELLAAGASAAAAARQAAAELGLPRRAVYKTILGNK